MKHSEIYTYTFNLKNDETSSYREPFVNKVLYSLYADEEKLSNERKHLLGKELSQYYINPIEYRYNNIGYRDPKKVRSNNIGCIALGDSFTEGEGVKYQDIWATKLEDKLKLPIYNFGICGSGPDAWFRVLVKYAKKFEGDYIFLLSTFFPRYNLVGSKEFVRIEPDLLSQAPELNDIFYSTNSTFYNYQIKVLAMEALANYYGKKLITVNIHEMIDSPINRFTDKKAIPYELARDCKHLGRDFHNDVVSNFLTKIH